ncbi:hypothetical protein AA309_02435 [Microvirga vignae]|uniref:Uncharacterized protein n=1 Tax=Microvirga vignae TaxID=1225564 RepID=A0A0H1RHI6_9HYPH|nr:hypothetical protein [Microvirga vignae]KLK94658.1 hypothetical protein AA309_02435 [Microvirga vignae]
MARNEAEKANIAAKEARQAADEPTLEPSFEPLVNTMHEAARENRDPDGVGPMSPGMAERIRKERGDKT